MVNDVHRIAHDLEELHSHDYGISGGSALQAGLTLPSVAELGDTEETSSHEWTSRLRAIRNNVHWCCVRQVRVWVQNCSANYVWVRSLYSARRLSLSRL